MFLKCDFCGQRARDAGSIRAVAGGFRKRWHLTTADRVSLTRNGTVHACRICAKKYNMARS